MDVIILLHNKWSHTCPKNLVYETLCAIQKCPEQVFGTTVQGAACTSEGLVWVPAVLLLIWLSASVYTERQQVLEPLHARGRPRWSARLLGSADPALPAASTWRENWRSVSLSLPLCITLPFK